MTQNGKLPNLPMTTAEFQQWSFKAVTEAYTKLSLFPLSQDNLEEWLDSWTHLHSLIEETSARLFVASVADTRVVENESRYQSFMEQIYLPAQELEQKLNQKLLDSNLHIEGFERPIENMRFDVDLFREENIGVLANEEKLSNEYGRIAGNQTVQWQGKEVTATSLKPELQGDDRARREEAWRLIAERQMADRQQLNQLWQEIFSVRQKLAANADKADYLEFRWQQMRRHDYTKEDNRRFHKSILENVVPIAKQIYQQRADKLGLSVLKPWDVDGSVPGMQPLQPFSDVEELKNICHRIFLLMDRELGDWFGTMEQDALLDLENRPGKAPGGFCHYYPLSRRPFIFMNAVGIHDDVSTLVHEAGHCFHDFSAGRWWQQWQNPTEFAEVASMSMELLSSLYWQKVVGGFYTSKDYERALRQQVEDQILFWPYMAVVDEFQLWAYENTELAVSSSECDSKWTELWDIYMPGIDYSDFDEVKATGWQRKMHIFQYPLYYIEYGIAQLGAVQIWLNSQQNYSKAISDYKHSLTLGAKPLPTLFQAAGAEFSFDPSLMKSVMQSLIPVVVR